MRDEDVGPVPVVEDQKQKKLTGIITDRDIAVKVVASGKDTRSTCVQDVMSTAVVTCCPDDDYSKALNAMARHQVRRIPVVDERGSLVGIISQADVARESAEQEVGEVVEEISEASGIGHTVGTFMPRTWRSEDRAGFDASTLLTAAASLAGGAAVMYLFDPDRGRTRRAKIADKTTSVYRDSANLAGKVQRDTRNRTAGVVAATKGTFSREEDNSDQKIEARVREKLGRVASYPHAIRVTASDRCVTVEGKILANEVNDVLSAVRSTSGVDRVENKLQVHDAPGGIQDLQGKREQPRARAEFMQANWSPAARFVAAAVGGGLTLYGLRQRGALAKTTATVGAGLLTRAVLNREITSLTDFETIRRALASEPAR